MKMGLTDELMTALGDLLLVVAALGGVVLVLTLINRNSKQRLAMRYGSRTLVWLGGLGIIIHELSHLLVARLFGPRINGFRLLITDPAATGGALGYVNHSWRPNSFYQFIGNAVIGTAPIWGCTAVLYCLTRWLVPQVLAWGMDCLSMVGVSTPLMTTDAVGPIHWLPLVCWFLLSVNITLGGFDLSNADLKGTVPALGMLSLIIFIIFLVMIIGGQAELIHRVLLVGGSRLMVIMLLSLLWSILVNLLARL